MCQNKEEKYRIEIESKRLQELKQSRVYRIGHTRTTSIRGSSLENILDEKKIVCNENANDDK